MEGLLQKLGLIYYLQKNIIQRTHQNKISSSKQYTFSQIPGGSIASTWKGYVKTI